MSLEYSMSVKLLTEQHLEFLSLKRGCTGCSESTLVKMPHWWKSHVTAQIRETVFNYAVLSGGLMKWLLLSAPAKTQISQAIHLV